MKTKLLKLILLLLIFISTPHRSERETPNQAGSTAVKSRLLLWLSVFKNLLLHGVQQINEFGSYVYN